MFNRVTQRPPAAPQQPGEFHGHLYCAAKAVHRAARSVAAPADADYLFTALANLSQLAKVARSPELDQADVDRWRDELAERCTELRRQHKLARVEENEPHPTIQMGPALRPALRQRATA